MSSSALATVPRRSRQHVSLTSSKSASHWPSPTERPNAEQNSNSSPRSLLRTCATTMYGTKAANSQPHRERTLCACSPKHGPNEGKAMPTQHTTVRTASAAESALVRCKHTATGAAMSSIHQTPKTLLLVACRSRSPCVARTPQGATCDAYHHMVTWMTPPQRTSRPLRMRCRHRQHESRLDRAGSGREHDTPSHNHAHTPTQNSCTPSSVHHCL